MCSGQGRVAPEGAWFEVSDKTKGPPAKISFLLKAAYSSIFLSQVAMFSAYVGRLFSVYIIVSKTWWPIESTQELLEAQ